MNRVHRIVFNRAKGVCQAVSEVATAARGGVGGTSPAAIDLPKMSVLASACVLAFAAMTGGTAWANGGAGGAGTLTGATGGAGATSTSATGADGVYATSGNGQSTIRAGGGGGGGGVIASGSTAGNGGAGGKGARGATGSTAGGGTGGSTSARATNSYTATFAVTGGVGGSGNPASATDGGGGGGGGGGAGIVSNTTSSTVTVKSVAVTGGKGGNGGAAGSGGNGGGGGGGQGGTGLLSASGGKVTIESGGTVTGGAGGAGGGAAKGRGGNGGDGGMGVDITGSGTGRTLDNSGTIVGGAAGLGGAPTGGGVRGQTGAAGVGLKASGAVTITNSGTIRGGTGNGGGTAIEASGGVSITNTGTIAAGSGGTAIQFSGGGNSLEIRTGSTITGNVVAGSGDQLILGGTANGTFDTSTIGSAARYSGFGSFIKSGTSTWMLTSSTAAVTPWTIKAGTLSIASDSALGAASGALTLSGGTLYTSDTTTLARTVKVDTAGGAIDTNNGTTLTVGDPVAGGGLSGDGRLTKKGLGTLVLATTDTHAGGTTLAAGTLRVGSGGTAGSLNGDVDNSGALVFDRSDAVTYSGAVSGNGTLTQQGTGTLTLTGTNTYTGGTTISAGTLVVGDGSTHGSIAGSVSNNGALVFNRSDSTTFGGAIHGSGTVTQQGTGTLILTGASDYSGTTTITAGTLQLGDGGTGGSIASGTIQNSGTLAFNRSVDTTYAGVITGTGAVTKNGGGTLTLTGDSDYTGATTVNSALLRVDGSLGNTAVTVRNGGALAGSGSIAGTVTISDGAVLRGASGQTLTTGALTFTGGSYLSVGLGAPSSQTPALFQVNGSLTLDGQLYVTDLGGFGAGVYRLINYTGSLTDYGLDVVSAPADSDLSVQTAVAHQVNLVNTAGQELKFWDGANAAAFNNGAVDGGAGTWVANGSNWTTANGQINSTRNAGYAVFDGPAGTVTIDNTQGPISVSGLQFASNGYVLKGDALTLDGPQAIIRVGDGSTTPVTAVVEAELTGTARLEKTDRGTLVLAGSNSYGGGTLISGGTLQLGNGGTTGSILGNVTNNGTLAFDRSDTSTFAGTITGSGAVQQVGSGTTVLTAANDYTGGTVISAGTLQLGNGGTSGSITGGVNNNGTLAFNRSDAVTFDGAIGGSGAVNQIGSGSTTLTGTNTYGGGTTISAGTLVAGAGSLGTGPIVDNAALELRQATNATLANAISGSGSITKTGAGALNLTGNSSGFTGSTLVSAGTLAVNGALGGTLTMASGTTLKGNGTVGSTVVQSGATVAPGNSIGLLNVAGNLTLAAGSTYQVEASGDGRSDQIHATGAINLQGGTVAVLADGNWSPNSAFSILKADGGVTGTFGSATTNMAFLDPSLSYDASGATLTLKRNDVSFSSVGTTTNERASGAAVESLAAGTLFDAVVQLDAPTAASAFRQLTGEIHASVKSAAIEDSRFVREAGMDRIRQAFGGVAAPADLSAKNGVWARAFGAWGDMSSDGNASVADRSTSGILIGGDTQVGDDWRVGVLGGYSRGDVDVHALNSSATSDSYHLGVYGGRQWGALGLRAGASYTDSSIDTRRVVSFTGFADAPTASYNARTAQAFGELGWRIEAGSGAVEPFANLAYVNLRTDDFAEVGRAAALHAASESTDTSFSTLGVRGSNNVEIGGMKATVHGMIGWRHAFGDVAKSASVALAAQPAFSVTGVPIARNAAVIEGGLDLALKPNLTLGVSYVGQLGDRVEDHGVRANLLWKF